MVKFLIYKMVRFLILLPLFCCSSCSQLEGTPLKRNYAPLTNEGKLKLENTLISLMRDDYRVTRVAGPVLEFINRFADYLRKDQRKRGLVIEDMLNANMVILPINEVREKCNGSPACVGGNLAIMPDDLDVVRFLGWAWFHEAGHIIRGGMGEYIAMATQTYFPIKAYIYFRNFGAHLAKMTICWKTLPHEEFNRLPFGEENYIYDLGALFAIYNLIQFNGDIDAALYNVVYTKMDFIEAGLFSKLSGMEGDLTDKYFALWKELLDSQEFLFNLAPPNGHLSVAEAFEFIKYLEILNYHRYLWAGGKGIRLKFLKLRNEFLSNLEYSDQLKESLEHFY